MTDKLIWKRGPWKLYKMENGRLRVDNDNHLGGSQYPLVLKTHWGYPLSVQWDHPESIPEYVTKAVISYKKKQVPKKLLR